MEFDEETWRRTEERLDQIHSLQSKYGATPQAIEARLKEKGNVWKNWKIMTPSGNGRKKS